MITKTSARRETDKKMHTGHFYFAKNRTFLLCVDKLPGFSLTDNIPDDTIGYSAGIVTFYRHRADTASS